jgi:hypothetical protein
MQALGHGPVEREALSPILLFPEPSGLLRIADLSRGRGAELQTLVCQRCIELEEKQKQKKVKRSQTSRVGLPTGNEVCGVRSRCDLLSPETNSIDHKTHSRESKVQSEGGHKINAKVNMKRKKEAAGTHLVTVSLLRRELKELLDTSPALTGSDIPKDAEAAIERMLIELEHIIRSLKDASSQNRKEYSVPHVLQDLQRLVQALKRHDFIDVENAYTRVTVGSQHWTMSLSETGIHRRRASERLQARLHHQLLENRAIREGMHALKRLSALLKMQASRDQKH